MKKLSTLVVLALFTFACSKKSDVSEVKSSVNNRQTLVTAPTKKTVTHASGEVVINSCEYFDVPSPTTYTGLTDPQTETGPGYGINTNDNYDRGWKDGYEDALYYLNYFDFGQHQVCSPMLKIGIIDVSQPGLIRYESTDYQLKSGESKTGLYFTYYCTVDWTFIKCVLQNQPEPKALRLQYQFNDAYPGRTQAQIDYDKGRLMGFTTGTTKQPYSIAP